MRQSIGTGIFLAFAVSSATFISSPCTAQTSAVQRGKPLCPGCNVVLLSLDAVQASHVHFLGYPRPLTPTLDSIARKSRVFSQAVSPAPWTVPATMSWFTGAYPSVHKVTNKFAVYAKDRQVMSSLKKLSPGVVTLAEVLRSTGYATGGFTGDAGVNGAFGFSQGFDVYFDSVPAFSGFERSIPKALEWLQGVKGRRFFLFLHGYNAHGQYSPADGFDRRYAAPGYSGRYDGSPAQQRELRESGVGPKPVVMAAEDVQFWRDIYDEKIARADSLLEGFMREFDTMGLADRTVFVIASDHGTELYEHGRIDHGATLYDELVHVPLLLFVPGTAGGAVREQVSTLSIMPTVLDILGIEPGPGLGRQMQAESLAPWLSGGRTKVSDVLMETDYRLYTHKRGIRTPDGWKLVYTLEDKRAELYELGSDPSEAKDLAKTRPDKVYDLEQRLFSLYKKMGVDLDAWQMGCSPVYADQCR